MDVGVAIPAMVAGTAPGRLIDWAEAGQLAHLADAILSG
jgi:hypothetical protein